MRLRFYQVALCWRFLCPRVTTIVSDNYLTLFNAVPWSVSFYGYHYRSLIPAHSSGAVFWVHGYADAKDIFHRAVCDHGVIYQWQPGSDFPSNFKAAENYGCIPVVEYKF